MAWQNVLLEAVEEIVPQELSKLEETGAKMDCLKRQKTLVASKVTTTLLALSLDVVTRVPQVNPTTTAYVNQIEAICCLIERGILLHAGTKTVVTLNCQDGLLDKTYQKCCLEEIR